MQGVRIMRITIWMVILTIGICIPLYGLEEFPIRTSEMQLLYPKVSGSIVVWKEEYNDGIVKQGIFGCDLSDMVRFPICLGTSVTNAPDLDNDIVVWQDIRNENSDIYGYRLSTGEEFPICTDSFDQTMPVISGNMVVWCDNRNGIENTDIYGYNLITGQEFVICSEAGNQTGPAISGNIVVWKDYRNDAGSGTNGDIYGYNLLESRELVICINSLDQNSPAISGNHVVWFDKRSGSTHIYAFNLFTKQEIPLITTSSFKSYLAISGDNVIWSDLGSNARDILGYNISESEAFPICTNSADQVLPDINGYTVIWKDARDPLRQNIYGTYIPGPVAQLTMQVNALEGDPHTVTPQKGIHSYAKNEVVSIRAERFVDCPYVYRFDHWEGDVANPNSALTTIIMDSDKTVTAIFMDDRVCGDECHPYLTGDLNWDCEINLVDMSILANNWLGCTKPECD